MTTLFFVNDGMQNKHTVSETRKKRKQMQWYAEIQLVLPELLQWWTVLLICTSFCAVCGVSASDMQTIKNLSVKTVELDLFLF